jgi:Xaa-Pro aminopeptidase
MASERLEEVRRKLFETRLQGFLVTSSPNIGYLTGFTGSSGILLLTRDSQVLITDGRYTDQVSSETHDLRIVIASGRLLEALSLTNMLHKNPRVGFESATIGYMEHQNLTRLWPHVRWVPMSFVVENNRSRKDEQEILKIKRAVEITDRVFNKILAIIGASMREIEVAAEISYFHKSLGADSDAFEPMVASGIRGALPHGRASDRKIQRGEMVTIDLGCRYHGYHSDLTRTVAVGKPSSEMRRIYTVVQEAHTKAIEHARSGISARSLDKIARRHIKQKGYAKQFNHSLGHGIGLELHELPRISAQGLERLNESNVITIEPGIYVPGIGGVRIEDDIIVRRSDCEVLSNTTRDLIIL